MVIHAAFYKVLNGDTYLNCKSGNHIYFREGNNTKMILDSGGNFGIGIDSPQFPLDISKWF